MNLHEYQAKQLLRDNRLPVPEGILLSQNSNLIEIVNQCGTKPWIAKCQIHAGGRGKAGGVELVQNGQALALFIKKWLGNQLVTKQTTPEGLPVNHILLEHPVDIDKEFYIGATIDRQNKAITFMASAQGGMDIETIAEKSPYLIYKETINLLTGPQPFQGRKLAYKLGFNGELVDVFCQIFIKLVKLFIQYDLSLLEINPLVMTKSGELICLDAKINIDNNALYRQTELATLYDITQEDELEAMAARNGLNYVMLEGDIGCLVNGAGLAMATMDSVQLSGGRPANFLDVGGAVTQKQVVEALRIIFNNKKTKAVLVNIFGGIVRCDLIADGIIQVATDMNITIPVIVRLEGNQADVARQKLEQSQLKIINARNLSDAAKLAVKAVENQ